MSEMTFAQEGFSELKEKVAQGYTLMDEFYEMAIALKNSVKDSSWEGTSKLEFSAFFDLIEQYHKKLLKEPLDTNKTITEELEGKINKFLSEFSQYNNL